MVDKRKSNNLVLKTFSFNLPFTSCSFFMNNLCNCLSFKNFKAVVWVVYTFISLKTLLIKVDLPFVPSR